MIDVVRTRKKSNLSNFAVVKSRRKFGGCLVDNNTSFVLKASFKFFPFNFI